MRALLWKDYRVNRLVLLAGLVLLVAPPAAVAVINGYGAMRYGEPVWPWMAALQVGAILSLVVSFITVAMLGGTAFACERADRSAEFLAYLPPTRGQIVASKMALAGGSVAAIWAVDLLLIYVVAPLCGEVHPQVAEELRDLRERLLPAVAGTSVCLFGAAWFGSSFLPSHGVATGLAFGAPVLLFGVLQAIAFAFNANDLAESWFTAVGCATGVAGFAAGIGLYLRRVGP